MSYLIFRKNGFVPIRIVHNDPQVVCAVMEDTFKQEYGYQHIEMDEVPELAAKDAEIAALTERVAELESRNKWWLENYDITMPCGHKNRYLDVNMKGELVRDENGDAVCTLCIVEAQ